MLPVGGYAKRFREVPEPMYNESRAVAEDSGNSIVSRDDGHDAFPSGPGLARPSVVRDDLVHATVSARLRAAREALGLTTSDVARRTRITLRHVEALEAGNYAALPGRPYALGFARAYALAVGLDGAAIADAVRLELAGSAPRPESRVVHQFEVGDPDKTPSRLVVWLAMLLFVGVLAMGTVFWRGYFVPAVSLPPLVSPAPSGSSESGRVALTRRQAGAPAPASAPSGGAVMFTALEEGIWVKFYDGQGKQLLQRQLAKGESYTVPPDALSPKLWTGRPDALAVTIGGQPVARLADTEKVIKDVPVDAASLQARASAASAASGTVPGAAPPVIR